MVLPVAIKAKRRGPKPPSQSTETFARCVTLLLQRSDDLINVVEFGQIVFLVWKLILVGIKLIIKEVGTGERLLRFFLRLNVVVH